SDRTERLCHSTAHRLDGIGIAHDREPLAEIERPNELGLLSIERIVEMNGLEGYTRRLTGFGIFPSTADDIANELIPIPHCHRHRHCLASRAKRVSRAFQVLIVGHKSS